MKHLQGRGIPLIDLVQGGFLGLAKGMEKLDQTFPFHPLTYLTPCIIRGAKAQIPHEGYVVPISEADRRLVPQVFKASEFLRQTLMREPSSSEIAECLNSTNGTGIHWTTLKVERITHTAISYLSTEIGNSGRKTLTLNDAIENPQHRPEECASHRELQEAMEELLEEVPDPRKKEIVLRIYGFNGQELRQSDLGRRFDVSRERIGQIASKTIITIRNNPGLSGPLVGFLD